LIGARVSTGVHSGPLVAAVVGQRIPSLVLLGPALSHTLELEHAANGGEVLVSSTTTEALRQRGASWASLTPSDALTDAYVLGAPRAGSVPWMRPEQVGSLDGEQLDPLFGIDPRLAVELGAGRPPVEHRLVTVSFIRVSRTDDLLRRVGVEATVARIERFVNCVFDACLQHGITLIGPDVDTNGFKLMLAAGVPRVDGLEHDRMLAAVRAVLDEGLDEGLDETLELALQIGVHAGPAFAGPVGSTDRAPRLASCRGRH
jgi:class 3 adenylate cyclase